MLGIILILALGMLGYAFSQQSVIIKKHEATPVAPSNVTLGVGVTLMASSSL